ncbi:MAG: HRDC domain-containing protein [Lewinellaceae bacterium]|nr:HRDC domain-containing protein [Lewinellaceae bacterium]
MQIRIFNIQIPGGEALNEEMNVFLRSKKIISVEDQVVQSGQGAFWCYSIKYIDDVTISDRDKPKVDYRQVLDEVTFRRFSALRDIRRKVAKDDAVPAYVVFSDEELAELAKLDPLTGVGMKSVKGIGEKKVEKYGHFFIPKQEGDEKGQ